MKKNHFISIAALVLWGASFSASAGDLSCPRPNDPTPHECAKVDSVVKKDKIGDSNGVGTAVGAVGGAFGSTLFSDSLTAKVLGGFAGAVAGNYTQRKINSKTVWVVGLVRHDGSLNTIEMTADPHLAPAQPVRVQAGEIVWVGPVAPPAPAPANPRKN